MSYPRHARLKPRLLALCALVVSTALLSWSSTPTIAQHAVGSIAYVRADTEDEIRLIEPDSSGDRQLWAHGLEDTYDTYNIYNMAWRPDRRELAFASTHENWCSINHADIFAIGAHGGGYRRITQAPACGALASYPKGTVRVPVRNMDIFSDTFAGAVYIQGAPGALPVALAVGGSTELVFEGVADLGPGVPQVAVLIEGVNREIEISSAVDVRAGETVSASTLFIPGRRDLAQEAHSPTWRSDGVRLGYVYGIGSLYGIGVNPNPVEFGEPLTAPTEGLAGGVSYMAYNPAPTHERQLLYQWYDSAASSDGIYLTMEGSTEVGALLVSSGLALFRGLAWLPDGSGFVYSVEEYDEYQGLVRANLFEYRFATQQSHPLTKFEDEFVGQMSVSPDGREVVFERSASSDSNAASDLWIVKRSSGELRLLVRNAAAPAWSPGALPPPLAPRAYLPLLRR